MKRWLSNISLKRQHSQPKVEDTKDGEIAGIAAVILIAEDFRSQYNFYGRILGLEVVRSGDDYAFFQVGPQVLGIFARGHHPQGDARLGGAGHGLSHLEFSISVERKAAVIARLDAASARAYGENFADKDGNLFHFAE
jgi:catechol 2,3-dioxygenase-like lactoylglutathione lyase family enzyme